MIGKVLSIGNRAVVQAKPKLQTFWYYARVELRPPTFSEIPQVASSFSQLMRSAKSGAWKNLTVKEAFLNALVTVEVLCWFFVGECIGKRHIIGYDLS